MPEIGRGRMGTLFILIMSLFVLMVVLAHTFYLTNSKRKKVPSVTQRPVEQIEPTFSRTEPVDDNAGSMFPLVARIRTSLAKHLPEGRETIETTRFRAVFDKIEIAALQNKVSNEGMSLFSARLRLALEDGKISSIEMDMLLDVLESAILN